MAVLLLGVLGVDEFDSLALGFVLRVPSAVGPMKLLSRNKLGLEIVRFGVKKAHLAD